MNLECDKTKRIDNLKDVLFGSRSFDDDRKEEIQFLKDQIKTHDKILIHGNKGVGKTKIIEAAFSKRKQINFLDFTDEDFKTIKFYRHLGLGSIGILTFWDVWVSLFVRFFLPIILTGVAILSPFIAENKVHWGFIFIPLLPLAATLLLFVWWIGTRKCQDRVIHITELNFVKDELKQNVYFTLNKIFKIYKNRKFIIESSDFDEDFMNKFDIFPIKIDENISNFQLVEKFFICLDTLVKSYNNDGFTNNHNAVKQHYINSKSEIFVLLRYFTYRELSYQLLSFYNYYEFHSGSLNIMDFLLLNLLKLKYENIFRVLPFNDTYEYNNYVIKNNIFGKIESFIVDKIIGENTNQEIISMIARTGWFSTEWLDLYYFNTSHGTSPFTYVNIKNRGNYIGNITVRNLIKISKTNLLSDPVKYIIDSIDMCRDWSEINFIEFDDLEAYKIISLIIESNLKSKLENDYYIHEWKIMFESLVSRIWNTRKNKELFFQQAPFKIKYPLLKGVASESLISHQLYNIITVDWYDENWVNGTISHYNFECQNFIIRKRDKIGDRNTISLNDYISILKNDNNFFQIKLNYLYSKKDKTGKEYFFLLIFLPSNYTITDSNIYYLKSLNYPIIFKSEEGFIPSCSSQDEINIIKQLSPIGF